MSIRILILGDIVGAPGRLAIQQKLPELKTRYQPDLVIANAENAADGSGLTPNLYHKLTAAGIDGVTLGDHVYKKKQIVNILESQSNIIRPANLSPKAAGKCWMRLTPEKIKQKHAPDDQPAVNGVYIITVLGRLFMNNLPANDPYQTVEQFLEQLPRHKTPIVLVEFHGEATSEKQAMGWLMNGRVAAVFGTHTHVPTADGRILAPTDNHHTANHPTAQGTAYISDLGMCGAHDSIIGRRVDRVLFHMTTGMPSAFDVADRNPMLNGIIIDIDENTGLATRIEQIILPADDSQPPFTETKRK